MSTESQTPTENTSESFEEIQEHIKTFTSKSFDEMVAKLEIINKNFDVDIETDRNIILTCKSSLQILIYNFNADRFKRSNNETLHQVFELGYQFIGFVELILEHFFNIIDLIIDTFIPNHLADKFAVKITAIFLNNSIRSCFSNCMTCIHQLNILLADFNQTIFKIEDTLSPFITIQYIQSRLRGITSDPTLDEIVHEYFAREIDPIVDDVNNELDNLHEWIEPKITFENFLSQMQELLSKSRSIYSKIAYIAHRMTENNESKKMGC